MLTKETCVRALHKAYSVVTLEERNWLIRSAQNGKVVALVYSLALKTVSKTPLGVKQAAKGYYNIFFWN